MNIAKVICITLTVVMLNNLVLFIYFDKDDKLAANMTIETTSGALQRSEEINK